MPLTQIDSEEGDWPGAVMAEREGRCWPGSLIIT